MKRSLYALFSQFGPILDIVSLKTQKLRGQAWIVFRDIGAASLGLRQLQGFQFYGKQLQIQYGKGKSDAVAKIEGTFVARPKKEKPKEEKKRKEAPEEAERPAKRQDGRKKPASLAEENPPSPILFVQNLPDETTSMMLSMLFQQ